MAQNWNWESVTADERSFVRAISLAVTRNEPARSLFYAAVCRSLKRGDLGSHFEQAPQVNGELKVALNTNERRHIKRGGRGRAGGGSQGWFSPSIGVLKAPWIINALSLKPPLHMSLCFFSTHFSFLPSPHFLDQRQWFYAMSLHNIGYMEIQSHYSRIGRISLKNHGGHYQILVSH